MITASHKVAARKLYKGAPVFDGSLSRKQKKIGKALWIP